MSVSSPALSAASSAPEEEFQYRPLDAAAVASLVLAALSLVIFLAGRDSLQAALMLCPLPLAGLAAGLRSLRKIREAAGQLGGGRLATLGVVTSLVSLVGGLGFASYVYATELPDGYLRTSFLELAPEEIDLRSGRPVSADVLALDGKKVFIKGYMRPDSTPVSRNVRQFLLVRDNNNCCFGDISTVKYYDQIGVKVGEGLQVDYHQGLYRIGGVLKVRPENAASGGERLVFTLDADYAG
jgi:hypothetical protein